MKLSTIFNTIFLTVLSQSLFASQCLSEFDDDYHYSQTAPMCQNHTKFFIGGLTDLQKQPVWDKLIVKNIVPAGSTAYVEVTPFSPLIINGQSNPFVISVAEGQCLNLISTYQITFPPQAFTLRLVNGDGAATQADFDFEVGSLC
jgi:hypothetical protein